MMFKSTMNTHSSKVAIWPLSHSNSFKQVLIFPLKHPRLPLLRF